MKIPTTARRLRPAFCLLAFAASAAMAGEAEELRDAAALIARVEKPLQAGDQPAYCDAMFRAGDYQAYLSRACESGVRNKVRQPQECKPEVLSVEAGRSAAACVAMPPAEFAAAKAKWREGRERFIKDARSKGVDGEQLLREEADKKRR